MKRLNSTGTKAVQPSIVSPKWIRTGKRIAAQKFMVLCAEKDGNKCKKK